MMATIRKSLLAVTLCMGESSVDLYGLLYTSDADDD